MSDLIKTRAFSAYFKWHKLDQLARPIDKDCTGFTQPDTITTNHTVNGCKHSAFIVTDQAIYGPEWSLQYTTPGFKENFIEQFNLEGQLIYSTFAKCLQDKAHMVWNKLITEEYPGNVDTNTEEFDVTFTRYIGNIA